MNAQIKNEIVKTKKLISPQQNNARSNNKQDTKAKPAVTYDYDEAVSQPDVPNFLGHKYNSLPFRNKKSCYSRGKSSLSVRKAAPNTAEDISASNTKSEGKEENELQVEERKYSKVNLDSPKKESSVENKMAKREITNEQALLVSKSDALKNDTREKDRQKLNSDPRNKIENGENSGNTRSNTSHYRKDSRIPRTKMATSPATIQVSRNDSLKRTSVSTPKKSFDSIANRKDVKSEECKKQVQSKFSTRKQQGLDSRKTNKEEQIDETIITETTPAVIGSASDPSTFVGLKDLKQSQESQSCDSSNLESISDINELIDNLSVTKSTPRLFNSERIFEPERTNASRYGRKKLRRSLKHRKYIDTSSDDFDVSSDYSSQSSEQKIDANTVVPFIKSSSMAKSSSRNKNRRGSSFSFFNTLFDIVFWPFLFLKSDR